VTSRQIERVRKVMVKAGHGGFARRALALARPAISLSARRAGRVKLAPGASKLGGAPDLPAGAKWPSWRRRPLAFLAQLNLEDLAGFSSCADLPREGLLQFFFDAQQRTWGFDPKDRGSWRVLLQTEIGKPARVPGVRPYPSCRLQLRETTTLISGYSFDYEKLRPTEAQHEAYGEALEAVEAELGDAPLHQLLGNEWPVQGEMEVECQLASNGLHCGDPAAYETRRARTLARSAGQWRLLLQLDTDEKAGMMWGDLGRLYFWITERALAARRFDECWMVLQSF
jgi:uncharacterized protein YwqG